MAAFSKREIKEAGLDDFRVFLVQVWVFLDLPPPTKAQMDIARFLQTGPPRAVIQGYRGVGKSYITVAFVMWSLFLNPQLKVMVVSAGEELAGNISKFCMQLIVGLPILHHLAPRSGQRSSSLSFDVGPATPAKDPSVRSVGITGQLTGYRADIIVGDDVETPKNSYTHLLRERLSELVKEFDAILKPPPQDAQEGDFVPRIIFLGTPQVEGSLYTRLKDRGYTLRIWPAEVPESITRYAGMLSPYILKLLRNGARPGDPIDPERFTQEDLAARKASYGRSGYALQFMLDTSPSDIEKHPLKLKDLIVHDVDPEMGHVKLVWGATRDLAIQDLAAGGFDGDFYHRPAWRSDEMAKYARTVMAIDPSGKGSDETAYAVVKILHGVLYLVDVGGYLDGFGEATLRGLAGKAARWGVNDIIVETNYGGGMFNDLLKPHLKQGRIDEEWDGWSSTQKEARICDTLEPVVSNHRLVVARRVIEEDLKQQADSARYSFIQQFTRMSRVKGALPNEDRLEAVSMAVGYFVGQMNRDQDKSLQNHRDALMAAELKRFTAHVFGRPQAPLKWR